MPQTVPVSITGGLLKLALSAATLLNVAAASNNGYVLTVPAATVAANLVMAGPASGSAAYPVPRSLVAADIPSLPYLPLAGGSLSGDVLTNGHFIQFGGSNAAIGQGSGNAVVAIGDLQGNNNSTTISVNDGTQTIAISSGATLALTAGIISDNASTIYTAGTFTGALAGNASTATRLSTNGTSTYVWTMTGASTQGWAATAPAVVTAVTAANGLTLTTGTLAYSTSGQTWAGNAIGPALGGTGVANNAASTLAISGNFGTTLTVTGTTALTLPTSGTLVNSAVATLSSLTSVGTIGTGTWQGTIVAGTYGGTGHNNGASIISLVGNLLTSGTAGNLIFNLSGGTSLTLPQTGTLFTTDGGTLKATAIGVTPLTVQAFAPTQTADILDIGSPTLGSTTPIYAGFGNYGQLFVNGTGVKINGLPTPTISSVTYTGTAGSTSYYYRVAALNGAGTTLASMEVSVPSCASSLSGSNFTTVNWSAIAGAQSYSVYGRTQSTELLMQSGITALTFVDNGGITPSGALPGNPAGTGIVVQGWQSQTGYLFQGLNSAGSSQFTVDASGNVVVLAGANIQIGNTTITSGTYGTTGVNTTITIGNQPWNSAGTAIKHGPSYTNSSSTVIGFSLQPTINQTSTAGTTLQLFNPTLTAIGSGSQRSIDWQNASSGSLASYDLYGNFTGLGTNLTLSALPSPTINSVTPTGTTGATTYTYTATALNAQGETIAGAAVTTTTGNATLSGTNKNNIVIASAAGATSYNVYRAVGGATQGKIGSVTSTGAATYTFADTGLAASGSSPTGVSIGGIATVFSLAVGSAAGSYGSGAGVVAIANATTTPSGTPSGGGVLYVTGGALTYKGSSGTVTTLAAA